MENNTQILSEPSKAQLRLADYVRNLNFKQTAYCYINPIGFITKKHSYCALGGIAKNMGLSDLSILLYPDRVKSTIESGLKMSDSEKSQLYKCPMCKEQRKLVAMIPHLNDTHKLDWKGISNTIAELHNYKIEPKQGVNKIAQFIVVWYRRAFIN